MRRIFLSHSYRAEDHDIVANVEAVIGSYGIYVLHGRHLGGEQLAPEIMHRIEQSDGLVAILTPRDQLTNGRFTAPQWVLDELAHARATGKKTLAVVSHDVQFTGVGTQHERAEWDPGAPTPMFMKLCTTLGNWRLDWGRRLKVLLLPRDLIGTRVRSQTFSCEYRFLRDGGEPTPWAKARCQLEVGGTYAFLEGAQDDVWVEVKITDGPNSWMSAVSPQSLHIEVAQAS